MNAQTEIEVGGTVVADKEPVAVTHGMDTYSLMALAIEREGAIEIIERLADLREREMMREAEHQFMEAFAQFKGICPPIPRNKRGAEYVDKAGTKSHVMYAPLDGIQAIVDPILNSVGLSYWWSSEATAETVITTCHLRHVGGHERTSSMALPVSTPPKATRTQGHAGTRSFNNRLTLSDVLGIQTVDDADGRDGDGSAEALTTEQVEELSALATEVLTDTPEHSAVERIGMFLAFLGVDAIADLPGGRYEQAVRFLEAKRAKQRGQP